MHPRMLSAGIENEVHWPLPSRSFCPFWLIRIIRNFACPCYDSSQIWARITKFAPNMQSWDALDWYWKWRSLTLTFKVILTSYISHQRRSLYWDGALIIEALKCCEILQRKYLLLLLQKLPCRPNCTLMVTTFWSMVNGPTMKYLIIVQLIIYVLKLLRKRKYIYISSITWYQIDTGEFPHWRQGLLYST